MAENNRTDGTRAANKRMMQCKSCGEDIAISAKTCPHCGAKNRVPLMKKHPIGGAILLVFILLLFIPAIVSVTTGDAPDDVQKVGEVPAADADAGSSDATDTPAAPVAPAEPETFGIGDVVSVNDVEVALVAVTENSGGNYMTPTEGSVFVVCEFEIDNKSASDIGVSSIMSFEAYVDDYATAMNLSAMLSTDATQLDGSVAAGKKMNGVIGYEVPEDWKELEIRFTPSFWTNKEAVFTAENPS